MISFRVRPRPEAEAGRKGGSLQGILRSSRPSTSKVREPWQTFDRRSRRVALLAFLTLAGTLALALLVGHPALLAVAWTFRGLSAVASLVFGALLGLTIFWGLLVVAALAALALWYPRNRLRRNLAHELSRAAPTVTLRADLGRQGGAAFGHRRVHPRTAHPHLFGWPRPSRMLIRFDRGHWEFCDDFRAETEALVCARLGGEWKISWHPMIRSATCRRRAPMPRFAELEERHLMPEARDTLLEGVGLDNALVSSDIGEGGHPFGLVVAPPGSGKTSHLLVKVAQYLAKGYDTWVFDVKRDLEWLSELDPERMHVAHDLELCAKHVTLLNQKMWDWINTPPATRPAQLKIAVVIDEGSNWFEMIRAYHRNNGGKSREEPQTLIELFELFRMGRRVGIRGEFATQRGDAKLIDGEFKSFYTRKTICSATDLAGSVMVVGDSRATRIPKIRGRGLHVINFEAEIIQLFYTHRGVPIFDRWRRQAPPLPPTQPLAPPTSPTAPQPSVDGAEETRRPPG